MRIATIIILLLLPLATSAEIIISDAWIKHLPASVPLRAGYMRISNEGDHSETVLSFHSEAFAAIEIHRSVDTDGVIRMQALESLQVSAGEKILLAPGGIHLMMIHPLQVISPGDQIQVWVSFDFAKTRKITMTVRQ